MLDPAKEDCMWGMGSSEGSIEFTIVKGEVVMQSLSTVVFGFRKHVQSVGGVDLSSELQAIAIVIVFINSA
eukprot:9624111-Lingulodinium_polyedra.AAC.1